MSWAGVQSASTSGLYGTLCPLASGGMGEVFVAVRHEGTFERLFALKRLKSHLRDEPEVRAMFLDEARLAGLVRHPNVVAVVDVGEDADGPFSVMEYVDGVSAMDLVRLASATGRPLPLGLCVRVARDVALGLHAAHELTDPSGAPLNLVHRDVSPQNILVGFDGVSKVTDFGIAKALGRTARTSTGVLKGKLGYMSPEQLRFEEPDRRADLFALGVVLFELLAGLRLYESRAEADGPRRILSEPPPDPSDYRDDVDPELVELIFRLLAKDREQRPATAKEVARTLEHVLTGVAQSPEDVDTGDFLEERFAPERSAQQSRIAEARRARAALPARSPDGASGTSGGPSRFPGRGRAAAAIAGALLLLILLAGGWYARLAPRAEPILQSAPPRPEAALTPAMPPLEAPTSASSEANPTPPPPRDGASKSVKRRATRAKGPLPLWENY